MSLVDLFRNLNMSFDRHGAKQEREQRHATVRTHTNNVGLAASRFRSGAAVSKSLKATCVYPASLLESSTLTTNICSKNGEKISKEPLVALKTLAAARRNGAK